MQRQSAGPHAVRGRGRPKITEDTELARRIVQAAYGILCTRGYMGMNMGEVASTCGVSKKTVYRLFPSKTELFRAITDAHRDAMIDVRADLEDLPLVEALVKIFRMDLDPAADEHRRAFMRVILIEALPIPELHQIVHEHGRDRTFSLLAEWLERQRGRGRIADVDVHDLTKVVIDVAFGVILRDSPDGWPNSEDRVATLRRCFTLLVDGIGPCPKPVGAAAQREAVPCGSGA